MAQKTITIDLTIKKWMKLAAIAVFFFLMSFLMMTCSKAQTYSGSGTATISSGSSGTATISSGPMLGSGSNSTIVTVPCSYYTPESRHDDSLSFKQIWLVIMSILFMVGGVTVTACALVAWDTKPNVE